MIHTLTFTAGAHSGTSIGNSDIYSLEYNHSLGGYSQFSIGNVGTATVTFTSNIAFASGEKFSYYLQQMGQSNTLMGKFTIKDIKANNGRYTYTCYDNIDSFNTSVDTWFNNAGTWSNTTAATLFSSLCTSLGFSSNWAAGNQNFPVSKTFSGSNINGRTILRLLAEVACANCFADADGTIKIKAFATNATTLDPSKYVKKQVENYVCPAINKFTVQRYPSGDNQWVNVGTGTTILKLSDSYFCYGQTDSTISTYFTNAFSWMPSYTPMVIDLQRDFGVNVGDIITVDGVQTIVMQKRITSKGVELSSYGTSERSETMAVNQEQIDLSNYYTKSETYAKTEVWSKADFDNGSVNIINQTPSANALTMQYSQSGTTYYGYFRGGNIQLSQSGLGDSVVLTGSGAGGLTLSDSSNYRVRFGKDANQGTGFFGYSPDTQNPGEWLVTKYTNPKATEEWNTVGSNGGTSEPSYSAWPSAIFNKKFCVKGFVLELKASTAADANVYATTVIMGWPCGTNQVIYAEAANGSTKAYCRIDFSNMQWKVWVNDITRSAVLKCFY